MALSWREKDNIYNAIVEYVNGKQGQIFTTAQMKSALGEDFANYSSLSIFAQMRHCETLKSYGYDTKGRAQFVVAVTLNITKWAKNRNIINFYDENDNTVLSFDFNTRTFTPDIEDKVLTGEKRNDVYTINSSRNYIREWVFSYADYFKNNLYSMTNVDFDCPKGYMKWIMDNNKEVSTITLKEFTIATKYPNASERVIKIADSYVNCYRNNDRTVSYDDVMKYANEIDFCLEHEYLDSFYMRENSWGSGSDTFQDIKNLIEEYIYYCKLIDEKPIWKNVLKNYSIVKRMAILKKHESEIKGITEYQNKHNLHFENNTFNVIIPTKWEQFRAEADYQQNCVCAYYYPKVAKEQTHIVFIRRKSDLNTPCVTCEVDNNGNIVQYLTRFNHAVTKADEKAFKIAYAEYLKTVF